MPYLAAAPKGLAVVGRDLPELQPGESVDLRVTLPRPAAGGRQVCWLTLLKADGTRLSQLGSAPLQLANEGP